MMHMDTHVLKIMDEIRLEIITATIRFEYLESPPRLVLNQGSKDLEEVKNFKLVL